MQSLLNQLQDDEALVMMYAADELAAEDRAQVEQRLAGDPALRASLERVRELSGLVDESLTRLDAAERLPVSQGVAVRKVGRVMRQWQTDRMAPPPPEEPGDQLRFPWWSYPLATAAAILLALIVWWGAQDGPPERRPQQQLIAGGPGPEMGPMMFDWDDYKARALRRSLWTGYEPEGLQIGTSEIQSSEQAIDDIEAIFMSPAIENERPQS